MRQAPEIRFWVEEVTSSKPRPSRPSGCDLCAHCTLSRLVAARKTAQSLPSKRGG